ncbi:T9SS type A sorting domain-containing protein [candidate division KSB1 bacterium]|nr:T9SS type A sorting domain-containing protein [candidate division KSB1 bacterium]
MKNLYPILLLICLLGIFGIAAASDWDELQAADRTETGTILDDGPRTCLADFNVTSFPYHHESTLVDAVNDCLVRSGQEHIYQVVVTVADEYTFSLCDGPAATNTQIYIKTGCCSGSTIATNDDGCGTTFGPARIDCVPLTAGTYWLIIEPRTAGGEGPYTLDISQCRNTCEQVQLADGVHDNGDGTLTYVQTVDASDAGTELYGGPYPAGSNPCVSGMTEYGFDIYSWYDQDYGWLHTWPGYNAEGGVCVQSVEIVVCSYDVDQSDCSELHPNNPQACELDNLFADAVLLNPNYLQGNDGDWAVTTFDVSPGALLADGGLEMFLDIDVWNYTCTWATTVHWSQLIVRYRTQACNQPPYTPLVESGPCYTADEDLCVLVTGPQPADPDGDAVTYQYRWFVMNDQTNGGFVDDEWNPLHPVDHSGSCIPAADTEIDDIWLVEVYAVDAQGTLSLDHATLQFPSIIRGPCGPQVPEVYDLGDIQVPECQLGYPLGTLETGGPANVVQALPLAWLGDTVTAEDVPNVPDTDAGDDGVEFLLTPWEPCANVCVRVTVRTGPFYFGEPMYIYGWKDGDLDCSWDDVLCNGQASECIIQGALVPPMEANGTQTLQFCFPDPGVTDIGRYQGRLRFRLMSSAPGCIEAQAGVDPVLGEVEDYLIRDLQLDVELLSFSAAHQPALAGNGEVRLEWSTASERDNRSFEIEKQIRGEWLMIERLDGAGTSTQTRNYAFSDAEVLIGTTYAYRLLTVDVNGHRSIVAERSVAVTAADPQTVSEYKLHANFPNPFNPSTTIVYDLMEAGHVKLSVFDVLGREIAVLQNGRQDAGRHRVEFAAQGLPSGLYLYRIEAADFSQLRKMILMK